MSEGLAQNSVPVDMGESASIAPSWTGAPRVGKTTTVSVVVAARVGSGVVLGADSRISTETGGQTLVSDGERKLLAVPGAPVAVALFGKLHVGPLHAATLVHEVIARIGQHDLTPHRLVLGLGEHLEEQLALDAWAGLHLVAAGFDGQRSEVWHAVSRPEGVECSEAFVGDRCGLWWAGDTTFLDRMVLGFDKRLLGRLAGWASALVGRPLSADNAAGLRDVLGSVEVPPDAWEALSLDHAAVAIRRLLEASVVLSGIGSVASPVGGPVAVAKIDGWSRAVTFA